MDVASAGSMKPGNGALMPIAARFFSRWNAITLVHATFDRVFDGGGPPPHGF